MSQYKTTDIVLAASLKVNGYRLTDIERVGNTNKGTFVFEDVDEQFVVDYDLSKIHVEPVSFNNAIKQLTTSVRRMS